MVVGAIIQTASYSLAQLIVGRIVTGFGNGTSFCTFYGSIILKGLEWIQV